MHGEGEREGSGGGNSMVPSGMKYARGSNSTHSRQHRILHGFPVLLQELPIYAKPALRKRRRHKELGASHTLPAALSLVKLVSECLIKQSNGCKRPFTFCAVLERHLGWKCSCWGDFVLLQRKPPARGGRKPHCPHSNEVLMRRKAHFSIRMS